MKSVSNVIVLVASAILITACGGGGGTPTTAGGDGATTENFTVGGTLTGLAAGASVTLQNNGGGDLTLTADGSFSFATALTDGSAYSVAVLSQPTSPPQTCTVTNGVGTLAGANVTDVAVACVTNTFTVSGTLTGLAVGASVTLQNNGGDDLTLTADGGFSFATALMGGSPYSVAVLSQPTSPSQTCTVTNGVGTSAGANVTNVAVVCVTNTFTVFGTLTGLAVGASVTLQNNGADDLTLTADGSFSFATALMDGSAYSVAVSSQPTSPSQTCAVTNGVGTLAGANVTDVGVTCVDIQAQLAGVFLDPITAIDSAFSVTLADVDSDGDLDLIAGNSFGEANRVYVNDGASGFTDSGQALGTNDTASVTVGDVDGDGDLDLVAGNFSGQANRVYVNDGAGNFTDSGQALGLNNTQSVTLGDVDDDGDLPSGEANRVYINDGAGSFRDSGQALGDNNSRVTLGDVDGDGDLDLVAGNADQANRVFVNDGVGGFTDSGQALGLNGTQSVTLGDVDGDGDLDLVAGNGSSSGEANRVYVNDGAGNFTDSGQALGAYNTTSVTLDDVDGDGDLDLVAGNGDVPGLFNRANRVYVNDGAGNFTDNAQALGTRKTTSVTLGDVDGDGDLDLVAGTLSGVPIRVYVNDGAGSFTDSGQTLRGADTRSVALGDVDNDGDLDLVEGNSIFSTIANRVYVNDGAGNFTDSGQALGLNNTQSVTLGDVDDDGDLYMSMTAPAAFSTAARHWDSTAPNPSPLATWTVTGIWIW
jgi:multisubunit Na+/H+ antiporter MnhB subunit